MLSELISYVIGLLVFILPLILLRAQNFSDHLSRTPLIVKYLFPLSLALFIGTLVVGFKIKQDIQSLIDNTAETRRNLGYATRFEINATLNDIDSLKKGIEKSIDLTHEDKKLATILKLDEVLLMVNNIKAHIEVLSVIENETAAHLAKIKEDLQQTHKRLTPAAPASPEAVGFASKAVGG